MEASEKLLEKVKQTVPVGASIEASEKLYTKVKETAAPLSASVSALLSQDELGWPRISFLPPAKTKECPDHLQIPTAETPIDPPHAAIAEEKPFFEEQAAELPYSLAPHIGKGKESSEGLSLDQLLLPAMAIMLLSILGGYLAGRQKPVTSGLVVPAGEASPVQAEQICISVHNTLQFHLLVWPD